MEHDVRTPTTTTAGRNRDSGRRSSGVHSGDPDDLVVDDQERRGEVQVGIVETRPDEVVHLDDGIEGELSRTQVVDQGGLGEQLGSFGGDRKSLSGRVTVEATVLVARTCQGCSYERRTIPTEHRTDGNRVNVPVGGAQRVLSISVTSTPQGRVSQGFAHVLVGPSRVRGIGALSKDVGVSETVGVDIQGWACACTGT